MLDEIEGSKTDTIVARLQELNLEFSSLADMEFTASQSRYFTMVKVLAELCICIDQAESINVSKDEIKVCLREMRETFGLSAYIHRIQNWPRGYQGDFETIEKMCAGVATNELATMAECIEFYAQTLPITQQHRNKLVRQEALLRDCIARNGSVLSVGCGGGLDVSNALRHISPSQYSGQLSFIDMDQGAIDLVQTRTAGFNGTYSTQNVFREISRIDDATFDLVLCGGIFDYFDERAATLLLTNLLRSLTTSGSLFFTNIAANNPFRTHMEYFCDWELIERSEVDITELISKVSPKSDVEIQRDSTGLALLVSLRKP